MKAVCNIHGVLPGGYRFWNYISDNRIVMTAKWILLGSRISAEPKDLAVGVPRSDYVNGISADRCFVTRKENDRTPGSAILIEYSLLHRRQRFRGVHRERSGWHSTDRQLSRGQGGISRGGAHLREEWSFGRGLRRSGSRRGDPGPPSRVRRRAVRSRGILRNANRPPRQAPWLIASYLVHNWILPPPSPPSLPRIVNVWCSHFAYQRRQRAVRPKWHARITYCVYYCK